MACKIKRHYDCDGTGKVCDNCGESEESCGCDDDDQDPVNCEGCDGTGRLCVEHESPCGDLGDPPQCDKAKKA